VKGPARKATSARLGTAHEAPKTQVAPAILTGALTIEQAAALPLPCSLPHTKAVKNLWRTITTDAAAHDLRPGDVPILEMLLVATFRHQQAGQIVQKVGAMVKSTYGPMPNPMLAEERHQAALADRLAQRFALSPEARVRLDLLNVSGQMMLQTLNARLDVNVPADLSAYSGDIIDGEYVIENRSASTTPRPGNRRLTSLLAAKDREQTATQ